ncbi:MAG TPA: DUF6689 family protein [Tahibacter sp.]|uniref:DUF6689 family protein n=1 Tax=Tahibacter sp. TaxID=2056211 RepID=UPI002BB67D91|nr:DUF6689 family protein [Tahibacter sp.]HSX59391.1 DUF6689 family protein [Tahibacter sp.]
MRALARRGLGLSFLLLALAAAPWNAALAQVTVTINGNVAHADISLVSGLQTYDGEVTITFDSPTDLTAAGLNLTAQLVNPTDPAITARLPSGVSVDPAFPVLITVEPTAIERIFASGMETGETGEGNLRFVNAYDFEIHTHELVFVPGTSYRVFKAPLSGAFFDITADVTNGSVRGRGRSGGFSQFMMVSDTRAETLLGLPVIALGKLVDLELRLVAAILGNVLRLELAGLLTNVQLALLSLNYATALVQIDLFILRVNQEAGTGIANVWRSQRDLVNDAGDLDGLARSLRYSIARLNGGP